MTVTGTGTTAGSGGAIQHASEGVRATDTGPVSLSNMAITNPSDGVVTGNVASLTMSGDTISSATNEGVSVSSEGFVAPSAQNTDQVDITGSTVTGTVYDGIYVQASGKGTMIATVTGNTVGSPSDKVASGSTQGNGIELEATDGGTVTGAVTNNSVTGIEVGSGIVGSADDDGNGTPTLNLTETGNTVDLESGQARNGLWVFSGQTAQADLCLNATGNTSHSAGTPYGTGMYLQQDTASSVFDIAGGPSETTSAYVGDPSVEAYRSARTRCPAPIERRTPCSCQPPGSPA